MEDEFDLITAAREAQAAYDAIPVISYEQLMATMNDWLLLADPGAVKLLLAVVFANQLPGDPVWLFLIAPSSGGKTELMNGLLKLPSTHSLSQLTPNTLLSGYKKKEGEASLLKELGTNKTLLFKDFTTLLDGNKDELKEIMAQLREVFDGRASKRTGTGIEVKWEGKMGFIAGCTPIIEQRMAAIGAMGERFLNYRLKQPRRAELRAKMKSNIGKDGKMRDAIQDAMAGYLKGLSVPEVLPEVPAEVDSMIEALTDFIAIARAVVIRSWDNKKEIEYIVEPEMSGRVYKQLYTLAMALLIMNGGEWKEEDSNILRKIAISSVHSLRYNVLRCLLSYKTQVKTTTIAMELGYPTTTMRRYLEDMAAISMDDGRIRILKRTHQGTGKPDLWEIAPEMRAILVGMGEGIEAVKEDSGFDLDEQDVPVGATVEKTGPTQEEMEMYQSGQLT